MGSFWAVLTFPEALKVQRRGQRMRGKLRPPRDIPWLSQWDFLGSACSARLPNTTYIFVKVRLSLKWSSERLLTGYVRKQRGGKEKHALAGSLTTISLFSDSLVTSVRLVVTRRATEGEGSLLFITASENGDGQYLNVNVMKRILPITSTVTVAVRKSAVADFDGEMLRQKYKALGLAGASRLSGPIALPTRRTLMRGHTVQWQILGVGRGLVSISESELSETGSGRSPVVCSSMSQLQHTGSLSKSVWFEAYYREPKIRRDRQPKYVDRVR
ncbi:hypothetical protein C8Q74DRAFT_1440950 [Fomes fomentarius]|nr:hypothetical protein C8Q74DRAFT_1440950 [Fomes fomentarius]